MPHHTSPSRRKQTRQRGAAMLVVMLMLLVGTTIASMTVYAITLEARSAGYYRQQAQTHYVAEAAMQAFLALPPSVPDARRKALLLGYETTPLAPEPFPCDITNPNLMCNYGEPDPALIPGAERPVVRLSDSVVRSSLLANGGGVPVQHAIGDSSLGVTAFAPWYVVDLSDVYTEDAPLAGQDASGNSLNVYLHAVATVRARTLLDDGTGNIAAVRGAPSEGTVELLSQQFTDGAYDMRAVVQLGPVPK